MAALSAAIPSPPSPPAESAFNGVVQQGDLLEVMLSVSSSIDGVFFEPAVVWEVDDRGFHVYYLTRCHPQHRQEDAREADQLLHVVENYLHYVPWESVNLHVPLSQFDGSPPQQKKLAFKTLGWRDLGDGGYYRISEESLVQTHPSLMHRQLHIGCLDSDSDTDTELDDDDDAECEELDEDGNLADLVAPEGEVELFTEASGSGHADMMNRAQREFEAWVPANEAEQRTKDLYDSIDTRIRRQEAARAWERGRSM